jgi:Tfp pilus assembly protein PilF
MEAEEFVRRLRYDDNPDKRFAFFLGAGCSVSSGIPAAGTLVTERWLPRLRDIRAPARTDLAAWAGTAVPGYDAGKAASFYGHLIDELFVTPDDRQREIELLCDGRSPAFGYGVLAQLVAHKSGRFNVVLTTNFDDLVADALYLFTDSRPLVIQHESLATFIRPTRTRPLVVKLHGDHRLSPRNTMLETGALERQIARYTGMVLNDRGLIFMGYGGNDQGIQRLLADLPHNALPFGAYWVHPQEPHGPLRQWLARRNGVWVKSGWFDEVMLLVRNVFDFPHPEPNRFTRIFDDYLQTFQTLSTDIAARPAHDPSAAVLKEAVQAAERSFPNFWRAVTEALRLEHTDAVAAENVYRQGIAQFPNEAPLRNNFGTFLETLPGRRDEAEEFYRRAVELEPANPVYLNNYALFLHEVRPAEAEPYYKRALDAAPSDAEVLGNYADWLDEQPGREAEADALYRRAIQANPGGAKNLGNYAVFLDRNKRLDEAESFYRRAIELEPLDADYLANYADLLQRSPGREREAEPFYERALASDPAHDFARQRYAELKAQLHTDPGAVDAPARASQPAHA